MVRSILSLAILSALGGSNPAATAAAAPNPAFAPVEDIDGLPRVLLIGDSISIGYTLGVRERLAGKANVHRIPENGGPTSLGVEKIDTWLGDGPWDVIHFNWGLHDIKYMPDDGERQVSEEDYAANLRRVVARMKETGATLIWCNTTPVPTGNLEPPRKPEDVLAYNAIAREIMEEEGITIHDLYAFVAPQLAQLQQPENVHFTTAGSHALAGRVAVAIEQTLQ